MATSDGTGGVFQTKSTGAVLGTPTAALVETLCLQRYLGQKNSVGASGAFIPQDMTC